MNKCACKNLVEEMKIIVLNNFSIFKKSFLEIFCRPIIFIVSENLKDKTCYSLIVVYVHTMMHTKLVVIFKINLDTMFNKSIIFGSFSSLTEKKVKFHLYFVFLEIFILLLSLSSFLKHFKKQQ